MLRPSIAKAADRLASQGQFGSGLHSGSTESAHLVLQNFFGAAALRGECAVGVFLDVATAFPSMARRLVIPTVANDEMWLRIVRAAGFTDWETQEIYNEAVDIVKWGAAGASRHTVAMVAALHDHSWTFSEGLAELLLTGRGTLAGTAVADVVFAVAVGSVHKRLHRELAREGLSAHLCLRKAHEIAPSMLEAAPAVFTMIDISYADDAVLPVLCEARQVEQKVRKTVEVAVECYLAFGMVLKFARNKSAALVQWAGAGAVAEQRRLMVSGSGVLSCMPRRGEPVSVELVLQYRHLGTQTTIGGNIAPEIANKAAMLKHEAHTIKKDCYETPLWTPRGR